MNWTDRSYEWPCYSGQNYDIGYEKRNNCGETAVKPYDRNIIYSQLGERGSCVSLDHEPSKW